MDSIVNVSNGYWLLQVNVSGLTWFRGVKLRQGLLSKCEHEFHVDMERPCVERPRENYDNHLNLSLWIIQLSESFLVNCWRGQAGRYPYQVVGTPALDNHRYWKYQRDSAVCWTLPDCWRCHVTQNGTMKIFGGIRMDSRSYERTGHKEKMVHREWTQLWEGWFVGNECLC